MTLQRCLQMRVAAWVQRNIKVAEALLEEATLMYQEAQRLAQEWEAAKKEVEDAAKVHALIWLLPTHACVTCWAASERVLSARWCMEPQPRYCQP